MRRASPTGSPYAFPLAAFDAAGRLVGYICPMQLLDEGHILFASGKVRITGRFVDATVATHLHEI